MLSSIVSGISKVGEGFEQPNQNFPLDIPAAKLLEWLIDRRLLGKNWKQNLPKIREMVTRVEEEIPTYINSVESTDVADVNAMWTELISSKQSLDYFVIVRVFSTLKSAAATAGLDGKSFFGQKYSDKRLQSWSELVSTYEKGYIYLGESAQRLGEWLNFDVPNLKKDVEKYNQQLAELQHKQHEHERNINIYRNQLSQQCNDLKISSTDDFRSSLLALTNELPSLFEQVVSLVRVPEIEKAISFHNSFTTFTKNVGDKNLVQIRPFPTLLHIIDHGNETVGEMRARLHPAQSSMPSLYSTQKKEEELQIDWVTVSTNEEPDQDIAINWEDGTGEIIDGSTPAIVWEDVTNQLDLDIEVVEAEGGDLSSGIDIEANQKQEEIEAENLTESMLSYATVRNEFLDNVFELEVFLQQRLDDLTDVKGKAASLLDPMQLLLSQLKVDEELEIKQQMERHTKDSVQKQLAAVSAIVQKFGAGGRLRQLIEIKSSGRYVDRLVGGLQQKQDLIDKSTAGVAAVQAKRAEIQEMIKRSQSTLEGILASSRTLKRNIEVALSKVYSREVTIVSPLL